MKAFFALLLSVFISISVTGCAPSDDMHIVTDPDAPREDEVPTVSNNFFLDLFKNNNLMGVLGCIWQNSRL